MFKRIFDAFRRQKPTHQPAAKQYPDPVLPKPGRTRNKKRQPRKRLTPPPAHPGNITYQDKLVRHLGYDRRKADAMLKAWREEGAELPQL